MTKITVAHSPDSDDAFMFYPLAKGKIDTGDYEFDHVLSDIETLNHKALEGVYEVSAISIHAYPYVADKYALLRSGASMGYKYGPILLSKSPIESIKGKKIGVPGKLTSAYLELKLYEEEFTPVFMNFDEITNAVEREEIDAGLIIHEGQLTYEKEHLHKVVDLGEWWYDETGLPLPLGGNAIRKDLGEKAMKEVSEHLKNSIVYSLEHEDEALDYALEFGRGLSREDARKFVKMYVNELTVDLGEEGMKATELLLDMGHEKGIIKNKVKIEFV
jgi:1,4-dihydroxy-6-naphthoate synthase